MTQEETMKTLEELKKKHLILVAILYLIAATVIDIVIYAWLGFGALIFCNVMAGSYNIYRLYKKLGV